MKLPSRRTLALLACLIAVAGVGAWRYHATRPDVRLRKGQDALRRGDADTAYAMVSTLRRSDHPDHAYLLHGEILYRQRHFADAVEQFNHIKDTGLLRREAIALSGQCLLQIGDLLEAERAFAFVLSEDPDHLGANHGLADLYYFQGALLRARDYLDRVMQLDPADGRAFWLKGHILKDLDRKTDAAPLLKDALARKLPDNLRDAAREDLGEILVEQGEFAAALEVVKGGDGAGMQALRADALRGLGRAAEAQTLLDDALRRHPSTPPLLYRRAQLYLDAGDPGPAAVLLEKAVQNADDRRTRHLLGQAYERLNRPDDAARERRRVEEIKNGEQELTALNREANDRPWDPAVRRRMAEVCRRIGRKDLAEMWDRAAAACLASRR